MPACSMFLNIIRQKAEAGLESGGAVLMRRERMEAKTRINFAQSRTMIRAMGMIEIHVLLHNIRYCICHITIFSTFVSILFGNLNNYQLFLWFLELQISEVLP